MNWSQSFRNAAFIFTLVLCVGLMGCADSKRLAELEQTNKELQAQVMQLQQELASANTTLNSKEAQIDSLLARLSGVGQPVDTNASPVTTAAGTNSHKPHPKPVPVKRPVKKPSGKEALK